jgi:hypothetical protein
VASIETDGNAGLLLDFLRHRGGVAEDVVDGVGSFDLLAGC